MANEFDSVFDNNVSQEDEFDTIFDGNEDGDLIDAACGFNESGECETDFDELHQTDHNADTGDLEDDLRVDDETDNAPSGAEGTDSDPAIDLAMGEAGDEFSADGKKGSTDADDFYSNYNEPEEASATTGEGPDVNMDEEDLDGEFDKMMESVIGEGDLSADEEEGITGDDDLGQDEIDTSNGEGGLDEGAYDDDFDSLMTESDSESEGDEEEESEGDEEAPVDESSDGYEEGDSDLVDLVSGGDA